MQNIPEDRENLILFLNTIGEARFETLLGILKIPTAYLSGKSAEPAVRVSGLIGLAEAPGGCGLERIRQALAKILQANPLETHSANEEALAEELLAQYRKKLENAIGTARFYGLPDRPLEKVFVELTVIEDFEIPRDAEYKALMDKELRRRRTLFPKDETEEDDSEETKEKKEEEGQKRPRKVRRTVKPEELLEAGKRSQVVGAPGCGKTTLLRWLALQTAKTSDRLPVFIELKRLQKEQFATLNKGFSKFLFESGVSFRFDPAETPSKELDLLEGEFNKFFATGRLVILLDGLDEIAETERHRLRTAVENYANHHEGGLTLIVSTRPYGYLRNFADLKAMEIEPLSDIQIGQFLDHWCEKPIADNVKTSLRKNPNLRGLARFPFLLAFIAHLNSEGDIPRIGLYQKIVTELIDKLDKDKGKITQTFRIDDPKGALKRTFLRQLSFERLFESRTTDLTKRLIFSFEELVERAEAFLSKKNRHFAPEDLAFDVCATPMLREVENERYTFAHLTIQEFLAAEELSKRDDCHEQFTRAFFDRQLVKMEVLPMTIGLVEKLNEFYELLSKPPESIDFVRLCLEARSLGYHQKAVPDTHYQKWQKKLTDYGLEKVKGEEVFSNTVFASFTVIETRHSNKLTSGFLTALGDQDSPVRKSTADALGKLGNASPDVIRALAEAQRDQDWRVRRSATDALGKLGNASPDVIRALVKELGDQNGDVRRRAANTLGKLGNASPDVIRALTEALRDQEWLLRKSVTEALVQLGNASPDVIRALTEALRDQDWRVRRSAAEALGKLGNASPDVIKALSKALRDQEWGVRRNAADALGKLGNASPNIIQALAKALHDQDCYVRQHAADALGKLGKVSPNNVIQALSETLHDQDSDARRSAADALGKLGNASPNIIQALSDALRDQDWGVRQQAAEALGKLGNASPDVIQALSDALRDQDWGVRRNAAVSLIQLGNASPDVIQALSDALLDQDWGVRQLAAEVLGKLGTPSPNVIHALSEALHDWNSDVRQSAADALGKLGTPSPNVIHALSVALCNRNSDVRQSAAEALGKLGNASPDVIRALVKALRGEERDVRLRAVEALERIGFDSPVFCEGMKLLLSDPDPELQKMALRSIGYPSTDPGLLKDLEKLIGSNNPEISEAAEDAYQKYKFKLEMLGLLPA